MEEFLQLIASSPDFGPQEPIQRGLVLNRVAKLLGLPSEEVYRQLRIVARKAPQTRNTETAEYRPEAPVLPARDAASNAMTELLGVLLDQPTYYASVASVFDPDLIVDGETQEIARVVVQMAQENPEFTVSQVISRFDSVRLANRITSLQASTEARGNHAATVEGAVRCVEQFRARRRVSELEAGLRTTVMETAPGTPSGSESERPTGTTLEEEHLARAHGQGIRQLRQFAARRHLACSPYTEAGGERTKEAGSASDGEGIAKGK